MYVADLNEERLAEVAAAHGDAVTTILCDVRSLADNKRAVAHCVATFGRLDVFVANAGLSDMFERAGQHRRGERRGRLRRWSTTSTSRA